MASNESPILEAMKAAEKALEETQLAIRTVEHYRVYAMGKVEGPRLSVYSMETSYGLADEAWSKMASAAHDVVQHLKVVERTQRGDLNALREQRASQIRREAEEAARAVQRGTLEPEGDMAAYQAQHRENQRRCEVPGLRR